MNTEKLLIILKFLIIIFSIQMFLFLFCVCSFAAAAEKRVETKELVAGESGITMMKNMEILALMCNTKLMGIWRSNQRNEIYFLQNGLTWFVVQLVRATRKNRKTR